MNRITYLAGVLAVFAFPVLADQTLTKPKLTDTITVQQCEMEKIQLLLDITQADIQAALEDLKEIQGDREDSPPKKIFK